MPNLIEELFPRESKLKQLVYTTALPPITPPSIRKFEPPQSTSSDTGPSGYGIGAPRDPEQAMIRHRDRLLRERPAPQDYFLPDEIDPNEAKKLGAPNLMYRAATTERTAQALWRDNQVRNEYADYLSRNGASPEEIDEIIKDIYMQQKEARKAMYETPVEFTVQQGK
jgi:hypothetical protein